MNTLKLCLTFVVCMSFISPGSFAKDIQKSQEPAQKVLFKNVSVFDGQNKNLKKNVDVLIEVNKISKIATDINQAKDTILLNGKGKVLMPGLIDAHWHSTLATVPQAKILQSDMGYLAITGAKANEETLMRGFTSVRDVGGNVFAIKKAIDEGISKGPRIYPSGAYLSQTAGHGDFRGLHDVPTTSAAPLDYFQRVGMTIIADGVPEVTKRAREVLRSGASQIKMMAGGGVSSLYDPLDTTQYSFEEMKAIVDVAKSFNTYVTIHANNDASIQQAIKAGVKSVEHGFLISDETAKIMAENDVWLSVQPILNDEDAIPFPDPVSQKKFIEVTNGTDKIMKLAKEHNIKLALGTDTLFDPELAKKQGKMFAKFSNWFDPAEVLKMATHDNAQLLKMSGPRDPYPEAKLGVVEEGAYADLILVDGNPLEKISLIADPEKNFVVIMKDGNIYKNTITGAAKGEPLAE